MFSHGEIAALRMVNQRLWGEPFQDIHSGVRSFAALQAQEFPYARWSIVQRTKNVTEPMVDELIADGRILRTHVMRPTWHFVAREDIRWMLELTGHRVHAVNAPYYRANGLTDFKKTNALFVKALKGGQQLERKQMRAVLENAGLTLENLAFTLVLMRAELDGIICSGAPRGKQQTYALIEERAPDAIVLSREEALAELVRRYFTTRGPATLKDFAWWSGLTQADGRKGLAMLGNEVLNTVVDGRSYWFGRELPEPKMAQPRVDLIQVYDEIGMAYTESRDALAMPSLTRQAAVYYNSILLNGRLIGHWRRTVKGKAVTFEIQLFRKLTKAESGALEAAQNRYTESLEDNR
ncbi:hypothetical protein Rhe02_68000 [Rhizocola hellebori]|uniref:Winged helix DNA-binding domain-containing protein n=1 Tax=Rhizocola hellebori TaxID=1392758 RepID=A0A8J3QD79_9ACTN|nr:winged helix DNA-binding domain-containing protein [Rhizocola hellebori]GIH08733.1 hypothetical protein Rhe02_68000 [Rhizocola hellebori]